ncbi:uncharacterized protein UTRI_10483_B [Ustilago trichophora]|uniref:Uncharacterized protein n=1 Tax=Ustilago trichophora TaxID=86804 RepID=A0A5C3E8Y8_9BASI|nr:uncharacterized protein UTRI_10483_B [Ustilago trichophora]
MISNSPLQPSPNSTELPNMKMSSSIFLTLLSATLVLSRPIPPSNELEEAIEGLLELQNDRHWAGTQGQAQVQAPARVRMPAATRQPHQALESRRDPSSRGSGLPGNRRAQAPDPLDVMYYQYHGSG